MPLVSARRAKILLAFGVCALFASACSKPKPKAKTTGSDSATSAASSADTAQPASSATSSIDPKARPYGHAPVSRESIQPPPLTAPPEALQGPGGVRVQLLKIGTGDSPGPVDTIVVDYSMWKGDGELALSSYLEETATAYSVSSIGPQFRSMLTSLKVGSKARYWIPRAALVGWKPDNWPDADLIIEVEMLSVSHMKYHDAAGNPVDPTPSMPPDTAGPPANATVTASGLKYVFLMHGLGDKHPTAQDKLNLTLDANAVDGLTLTPLERGLKTATTLERAPGHLEEILALMTPGDRVRVWLPGSLAKEVIPKAGTRDTILDLALSF